MRATLLISSLVLGILGCRLDPEDPLFIYGTLPDAAGAPQHGRIELWRATSVLGMSNEEPTFEFFSAHEADANGDWWGELTYFDTILPNRGRLWDRQWKAIYAQRADLPPVVAEFTFNATDVDLPPLRQWDPRTEITQSDGMLRIRMTPPPRIVVTDNLAVRQRDRSDHYGLQLYGPGDLPFWFIPAGDAGVSVDLPVGLLEDFEVTAAPVASSSGPWAPPDAGLSSFSATESMVTQTFPKVPLAPADAPVISRVRHRPCVLTPLDDPAPVTLTACEATNGRLDDGIFSSEPPVGAPPPHFTALEIPLPTPSTLSWIVVRHLTSALVKTVRVEVRRESDGQWQAVGDLRAPPLSDLHGAYVPSPVYLEGVTSDALELAPPPPEATAIRLSVGETYSEEELMALGLPDWAVGARPYLGRVTEVSAF